MSTKTHGAILLVAGVLLFLISAAADTVGLGAAPGFGWKQLVGLAAGVVVAAAGMVRLRSDGG